MTTKYVLITNGEEKVNQLIASHFENRGYECLLLFYDKKVYEHYALLNPDHKAIYIDNVEERILREKLLDALEGNPIDSLIHGNEMLDEEVIFDQDPLKLNQIIVDTLNQIYVVNKVVIGQMVKPKKGKVIFPLFYDPLYYAGYSSSPILNQAKLSLMKCMSRELGAFKLNVNAMTFGYYNNEFEKVEKKSMKNKVEIFSLKPKLPTLEEYIPALGILIDGPSELMGGENVHVGAGIETGI
ncbi:SDR family NAD(P)-dependent oxidoreductase [Anaerobacillus sp. 1_MG-2023]|uniref:SDR family NAD(P)-dependent oxidoreductase n=1 Tax=Anaerobacillus sp. 1_MG-2023 TaxID=3062655 RepID=UPI0026E15858|nr:SDR family NAD(P)-dependent oxidoreductase [Anaerobacillus sp. 1_MG-2023]MDO6657357.1 SDR family NAD(P)-dependent oxidoreductase [Anaerobacillus sp. 1_MG-2023]